MSFWFKNEAKYIARSSQGATYVNVKYALRNLTSNKMIMALKASDGVTLEGFVAPAFVPRLTKHHLNSVYLESISIQSDLVILSVVHSQKCSKTFIDIQRTKSVVQMRVNTARRNELATGASLSAELNSFNSSSTEISHS